MNIKILGTGCPKCQQLMENAEAAARELNLDCEMMKISDINQIMGFGVMMTPALAVNGEVKVVGKVASVEEIKAILSDYMKK